MTTTEKRILFVLAALWGGSFIFIREAAPVFGPLIMVEIRVTIAGLALTIYARMRSIPVEFRKWWRQYFVLGALNSAIPFLLVSSAEVHLSASMAVLLNATSPLFGALVSAAVLSDPLTFRKSCGIGVCLAGVVALVGWSPLTHTRETYVAVGACLAAALTYGFAGAYIKTSMKSAPAIGMAAGSMSCAALLLLPFTAWSHLRMPVTGTAIGCVLALAFICTTLAYILYFRLVITAGPAKALSVTFLTPVFGLTWGAMFIGEPLTLVKVTACIIILAGTALLIGT